MRRNLFVRSTLPLILFLIASCSNGSPKLYSVRGTILVDQRPAEGATVILEPVGPMTGNKPSGTCNAEGEFVISTYPHGEGAPPGEYTVLVTWYPAEARQTEKARNKLPDRYADPARTTVPKVTIKEGTNQLGPIHLTSK